MGFTKSTVVTTNISDLADQPTISATELKAKFDKYGTDDKPFVNSLIDELEAVTGGSSIGTNATGVAATNVTDALAENRQAIANIDVSGKADKTNVLELNNTTAFTPDADYEPSTKKYVDDGIAGVVAGSLPDGSVEDIKLSNTAGQIKARVTTNTTNIGTNTTNIGNNTTAIGTKATEATYTATVTATWTGSSAPYTQVITVTGMLATDNPIVDVDLNSTYATALLERDAYSKVEKILTATNSITVYADEATTQAYDIQLKVVD